MNILRMFVGNRRKASTRVRDDKRGGLFKRSKEASAKVDDAAEELTRTITICRKDFEKLIK